MTGTERMFAQVIIPGPRLTGPIKRNQTLASRISAATTNNPGPKIPSCCLGRRQPKGPTKERLWISFHMEFIAVSPPCNQSATSVEESAKIAERKREYLPEVHVGFVLNGATGALSIRTR